jgi:outer membrane protein assembly factor BamA
MKGRIPMMLVLLAATLAWCSTAQAAVPQSSAARWRVGAIQASGSQRCKEARIAQASGLKAGSMVNLGDLQAAAARLAATGAFGHVAFHYGPGPSGIAVTFQVTDAEQFLDCRFANFIWLPETEILADLRARVPLFEGQVSTAGEMANRIDRALEAILREHGITASVDHEPYQNSMGAPISAEVFKANGPSLPVREVVFTGNRVLDSAALAKAVQLLLGHEHDEVFEEEFFKGDPADLYYERGYLRVAFGKPQAALITPGGTSGPLRITVPVTEGLQYNFGEIAWSGNTAFSPEQLTGQIHLETGKPANGVQLDHDLGDVAELYGTRGYLTAHAGATPAFDDASRTVNYQVAVTEGDQYRMGQLVVIGIDGAHADILKRDCKLRRGDPFDQTYWKYFLATNAKDLPADASKSKKLTKTQIHQDSKTVDVTLTIDPPVAGTSDVVGQIKAP